jgi:heme oxygenase (biliverdin-IX-beta and delta-forming)
MSGDAALARELVARARAGTLATVATRPPGYPYASLVALAADDAGRPLLLLSTLAEHTKNLAADPRASVLVSHDTRSLEEPRVTLVGRCVLVPPAEAEAVRARYLEAQPAASQYVGFADLGFYRLEPEDVRVVVGFGRMSWVDAATYASVTTSHRT